MNSAQIHLALTHVPVILSLVGLAILIIALLKKSNSLIKTSYYIILFAGIAAIPVYLSGEGTEELIERLPGVSELTIERHEEVAKLAMISIVMAGLAALAGLFLMRNRSAAWVFKVVILILTISSGVLLAQTAHLGGLIRHTEIRSGAIVQGGAENGVGEQNTANDED